MEDAWDAVHEATPAGWYVGRPSYHDERREWVMYAFDPSERPMVGLRNRGWTAIALTEEGVVREMARCLAEIRAGRAPRKRNETRPRPSVDVPSLPTLPHSIENHPGDGQPTR